MFKCKVWPGTPFHRIIIIVVNSLGVILMPTLSNFRELKISPADISSGQLCKNWGGYQFDLSRHGNALVKLNFD